MQNPGTPWIRLNLLFATLLLITGLVSPVVSAQTDPPEGVSFLVSAYTCDSDPGNVSVAAGNIPAYCSPTAGVWFSVATWDGSFTGGCTSDGSGMCSLLVPDGATVTVTEDTSTIPAGTLPRINPITMDAIAGSEGALFINLPTAPAALPTETPVEPTEVPALPTEVPILPTEVPVLPTEIPLLPTEPPVLPTEVPALPTEVIILPTEVPVLPTEEPTTEPVAPLLIQEGAEAPTEVDFRVTNYTCDRDPGNVSPAAGNIPDYCHPSANVSFTVKTEDGSFTGSCNTNASGMCSLMVPNEATVTVTEDTTTAPAGTTPRQNPITTQAVTEFAGAFFVNLPAAATATATATPTATATATPTKTPTATPTKTPTTTTYGTVSNTGGASLRCRAAPNTSSSVITLLRAGSRIEARGATVSGWVPVRCAGQNGWVSATYMALSRSSVTPTPTSTTPGTAAYGTVSNTGGLSLRCRTAPVSGAVITLLPAGSRIETRGATVNGWTPVRCGGQNGWVSANYISLSRSSVTPTPIPRRTPTPTPTTTPGTTTYGTVSNTGGASLRCRTAPNTSSSVITLLPAGTSVQARGAATNGWLPVSCGGQNGWVSATYISLSRSSIRPTPTPTPGRTPAPAPAPGASSVATVSGTGGGGLRCRTAPISGATITVLPELARVEVIGSQQNGWAQVRCAGQTGWASAAYLMFNVGTGGGSGEIWIDVNLSTQYMIVYQGNNILAQTYVSTGRPGFDTPTGTYYVNYKLPSQTMTGVLGGEYYYVPNVPSVMYFTDRGHAIHGAYWHNNFGYRMSHGCINLPVGFASWLYSISPYGTRIRIHF